MTLYGYHNPDSRYHESYLTFYRANAKRSLTAQSPCVFILKRAFWPPAERSWFSSSVKGPGIWTFNKLPGDLDTKPKWANVFTARCVWLQACFSLHAPFPVSPCPLFWPVKTVSAKGFVTTTHCFQELLQSEFHNTLCLACMLIHFGRVRLLATLWTVTHQAPLSMGFSRQEYWSGLPCPPPRDLPQPRQESNPCASCGSWTAGGFFTTGPLGKSCPVVLHHRKRQVTGQILDTYSSPHGE